MPWAPPGNCSTPGCSNPKRRRGRCADCVAAGEQRRGSARQRGYGAGHEKRFRPGVLRRDPLCVCTDERHGHGPACLIQAVHADHHPHGRDELIRLGLNPNDPQYGRGLCHSCHSKVTAEKQPGGWNIRSAFLAAAAEASGTLREAFNELNKQEPRG